MIELTAAKDDDGRRLDRILRKALPDLSLSLIHRLLRQKKILVDNKPASLNHRIKQGMTIKINTPATHTSKQVNKGMVNQDNSKVNKKSDLPSFLSSLCASAPLRLCVKNSEQSAPQALVSGLYSPVPILWQGSGIIVFNKPRGLSSHGPNSLDSIVKAWLEGSGALPRSLSFKPGPLHRLDKPTSGAIAFSQTLEGARLFSSLLRERKLEKVYIAIVEGRIEKEETWQENITHDKTARRSFVSPQSLLHSSLLTPHCSLTKITPLASNGNYSLIEARIKTGRHHQIRAQAGSHGHPLAGDIKYGAKPLPGQSRGGEFFLHAWKIRFTEKPDGFPSEITAPLPEEFQLQISTLFASACGARLLAIPHAKAPRTPRRRKG